MQPYISERTRRHSRGTKLRCTNDMMRVLRRQNITQRVGLYFHMNYSNGSTDQMADRILSNKNVLCAYLLCK